MPLWDSEQMVYGKKHFHEPAEFLGVTTFPGGKRVGVKAVTAAYTFTDTDGVEFLLVTTAATAMTMTLPTAADNTGRVITIRKVDTGAGKITVDGEGAETIDGNATVGIWYVSNFLTLLCTGTGWIIVGAPDPILHPRDTTSHLVSNNLAIVAASWTAAQDASSHRPVGAKTLWLKGMVYGKATAAGWASLRMEFSDNNSSTPTYATGHPGLELSWTAAGANNEGEIISVCEAPVTAAGVYYVYGETVTNLASARLYAAVCGYLMLG
jgi:hypothetical protein